jgi:N-methylhydantoinase A
MTAQLTVMAEEARRLLDSGGYGPDAQEILCVAEVRYFGQMTTLPITLASLVIDDAVLQKCAADFARAHEASYGYSSPTERLQFVALKVLGRGLSAKPRVPRALSSDRRSTAAESRRPVYFGPELGWLDTLVTSRDGLATGPRRGPMIIEEYDSTSVVRPGWTAELDAWSNIVMRRSA